MVGSGLHERCTQAPGGASLEVHEATQAPLHPSVPPAQHLLVVLKREWPCRLCACWMTLLRDTERAERAGPMLRASRQL